MLGFLKAIPGVNKIIDVAKDAFGGLFKALPPEIQKAAGLFARVIPPAALGMTGPYGMVAELVQESIIEETSGTRANGFA